MLPIETPAPSAAPPAATHDLSPIQRAIAIFVRPAAAWSGLAGRAQWWLPLLAVLVVTVAGSGLIYRRAQLPTIIEAMEERVQNEQMTADQLQKIEGFYSSPGGLLFMLGVGTVWLALLPFLVALLVWFAVGFVLGSPFRYRYALEVTTWSSLVTLPPTVLSLVLGWIRESVRGVHVGFAILLPEAGPDDKLLRAVGVLLDWIGPFGIWHVAVAILGAAYLSGAPRRSVAWALGTLYVVSGLVAAALAALIPGGA